MNYSLSRFVLPTLCLFAHVASGALNVPITVKNSTNVAIANFPVAVGVPLPKGRYPSTLLLMVTNANGTPVSAQVDVLNRHWATDNSLRHVLVHCMTDVAANGKAVYYLKEGVHTAASPLSVEENNDQIVVTTGPLRVGLNKKNFYLFNQVDFDRNLDGAFTVEERIIAPDAGNGGIMMMQNGDQQQSSDTHLYDPPMEVELEERGPIRAVVRFETCTNARSDQGPVHGFQARVYFYAGSELIRVQYTIKNSDHRTGTPRPLYFKDLSLVSRLAFIPTTVKFETNFQKIQRFGFLISKILITLAR